MFDCHGTRLCSPIASEANAPGVDSNAFNHVLQPKTASGYECFLLHWVTKWVHGVLSGFLGAVKPSVPLQQDENLPMMGIHKITSEALSGI
jgi:hypothetical protein